MKTIKLGVLLSLTVYSASALDWRKEVFEEKSNHFDTVEAVRSRVSAIDSNQKSVTIIGDSRILKSVESNIKRLNVVTFNPANSNEIWVGSASGGIWRSDDGGDSWTPKGDEIKIGVSDIVFDPTDQNIMYLATGDYDTGTDQSIGVYKSTDHGETWEPTGLVFRSVFKIAHLLIDPNDTNIIFATTNIGVFRSDDGGANWVVTSRSTSFNDIVYKEGSATTMFATRTISTDFFISTDNGKHWKASSTGLSQSDAKGRLDIATTAADPEFILAVESGGRVFKSTNGGGSWEPLPNNPPGFDTKEGRNQTILIAPDNKDVIIVGGVHGWRSIDGGATWQKYLNGSWEVGDPFSYVHSNHHDLEFLPGSTTVVFSANDGGLFKGDIATDAAWINLSSKRGTLRVTEFNKNEVTLYPNPTEGVFTIQLKGIEGESAITVYNAIGGVVENFKTKQALINMNTSRYSPGIYMVNVKNGNKRKVKKIIVK